MPNDIEQLGKWQPWHPREVATFFSSLKVPWWITGGWALDLFIGVQTRDHDDIDVQILRRDQQEIRILLQEWDVQGADPSEHRGDWPFLEWKPGTLLDSVVHDVWCRPKKTDPWAIQLMIANTEADQWLFRRDARISRPLATIGYKTDDAIPYLAPEIQLLYKAKKTRLKDEIDLAKTLPYLSSERRQWLTQALTLVHPNHPWLIQIEKC
jgi:hypothetical protein